MCDLDKEGLKEYLLSKEKNVIQILISQWEYEEILDPFSILKSQKIAIAKEVLEGMK